MAYPPTPPLLLTRRLSSFLHASLDSLQQQQAAPALQTALLITPSGKLLAYESSVAVRTLRTQCSVAASLWAIHAASSPAVGVALGHPSPPPLPAGSAALSPTAPSSKVGSTAGMGDEDDGQQTYNDGSVPVSIAASFNGGAVFVVRRLRCGLLFACATPPPSGASRPPTAASLSGLPLSAQAPGSTIPATAAISQSSLLPQSTTTCTAAATADASHPYPAPLSPSAPSTLPLRSAPMSAPTRQPGSSPPDLVGSLAPAASIMTTGTTATAESYSTAPAGAGDGALDTGNDAASMVTTAGGSGAGNHLSSSSSSVAATVAIARRQVEQLARLLDEKLGALCVPEENIGVNGFR